MMNRKEIRKEVWKKINTYFNKHNTKKPMSIVVQAYHINKAINIAIDESVKYMDLFEKRIEQYANERQRMVRLLQSKGVHQW